MAISLILGDVIILRSHNRIIICLYDAAGNILLSNKLDLVSGVAANACPTGPVVCIAILINVLTASSSIHEHSGHTLLASSGN